MIVEADSAESLALEVDVGAIGQVLRNLVDNATKYAGNGKAATVHLQTAIENGSLVLRVRDHGPGIPAAETRAIFKPFDRGPQDPSGKAPGIGLGLALARGLARDMGGDLTLERPRDAGACFRLTLPIEDKARRKR